MMEHVGTAVRETTFERTCDCGETYHAIETAEGPKPPQCPVCMPDSTVLHPVRVPATRRRDYEGDILQDLHDCGVNVHGMKGATLATFDPTHDPHALEAAEAWIEAWKATHDDRWPARDWMYLYGAGSEARGNRADPGATGNGKTMLAVAIARHLIEEGYLRPARYRKVTAETILLEAEASYRSDAEDSVKKLLNRYQGYELLHIDDFGVRKVSDHPIRIFAELAERRKSKATIWTSNLSLGVVQKLDRRLQRITSRIMGECGDGAAYIVKFSGPDRRRGRATGEL